MRKDIAAGTYNAYIVVKDDEGNLAKTEFTFIVKEKPIPSISLELSGRSGEADLIVLSVIGPENQASAKATIEVIPATMTFDLVEGRDNQTVVAGQDIAPIVYQYSHMYSVKGNVPANLKAEQDKEKKQVKISGTIDPESATHEYTYTFELTDYYEQKMTVSGKIKVVASSSSSSRMDSVGSSSLQNDKPSSSSTQVASSSSSTPIVDLSSSSAMSSGSDYSSNIVAAMPSFVFSYANNELTVVSPNSAMVRVQVFDLIGSSHIHGTSCITKH